MRVDKFFHVLPVKATVKPRLLTQENYNLRQLVVFQLSYLRSNENYKLAVSEKNLNYIIVSSFAKCLLELIVSDCGLSK
jgi:hypothetical protein